MRRTFGTLLCAFFAVFGLTRLAVAQIPSSGGGITGTMVASFKAGPVPVPDIQVTLTNPEMKTGSPSITTGLNGRFGFPVQPPGSYKLCWQAAGWHSDCLPTPIVVTDGTIRVGFVTIHPEPALSLVYGEVTLSDGSACLFSSPFFGIDLTAHVSAVDGEGRVVAGPVRANIRGQYVLAGVPSSAARVAANCERATVESAIPGLRPGADTQLDLFIHNYRPEVLGFLPTVGQNPVRLVSPGATVKVQAEVADRDGDAVSLSWKAAEGGGAVEPQTDGTVQWALPRQAGFYTLYVLASDDKGGISQGRLSLNVGGNDVFFSGVVTGTENRPIAGASVTVNAAAMTTGADGVFSMLVPQNPDYRYVVTVIKTGYVPQSRIFPYAVAGTSWHLVPAQVTRADPENEIDIQEEDGRGPRLQIPANALIDENGAPPGGMVNIALAPLNPDTAPMPGNDGGINSDRRQVLISQYGGVYFDVSDAAGHHYSLRPGVSAEVSFPIAPSRLRTEPQPPGEIAMWAFDEVTGEWSPHGIGKRAATIWDTIWDGSMSAAAAAAGIEHLALGCVLVDAATNEQSIGVAVQATPAGGPPLPPFTLTGQYNLMLPLPMNTPVTLQLLDATGAVVPNIQFYSEPGMSALPNNVVEPGTTTGINFPATSECGVEVGFSLNYPPWAGYPSSQFLAENVPEGNNSFTQSYYGAVDPNNKRTTLGGWWAQNGFNSSGMASGDTLATYLNTNELGVGSYVRCSQSSNHATTACYMTIYGSPNGDRGNADLAYQAVRSNASMTLAMERRPVETTPPSAPLVKFFAYAGAEANSARVNSVDLDGLGARYLPSACVVCHGGGYYSVTNNIFNINNSQQSPEVQASFREFDRTTLMSPSGHDQSAALDTLNSLVAQGNPVYGGTNQTGSGIAQLIAGWYHSGTFDSGFIPPDWNDTTTDQAFYSNAVSKSCRTCHDAFDSGINWTSKANFVADSEQQYEVCADMGASMPNAELTYINFWLSTRPEQFQTFFQWPASCLSP